MCYCDANTTIFYDRLEDLLFFTVFRRRPNRRRPGVFVYPSSFSGLEEEKRKVRKVVEEEIRQSGEIHKAVQAVQKDRQSLTIVVGRNSQLRRHDEGSPHHRE